MNQYLDILKRCLLFEGIEGEELIALLACLHLRKRYYEKGEYVFSSGEKALEQIGIVLAGSAMILQEDYWGNRAIISKIRVGDIFGEAFACAQIEKLPVNVVAAEPMTVAMLDYSNIASPCTSACGFHARLIKNMMGILAKKNVLLMQKLEHLSKRSTKEKLLSYLSSLAIQQNSNVVILPFNRQDLADYLSVDRSAMSTELGKMQKQGLIRYKKNRFELLHSE